MITEGTGKYQVWLEKYTIGSDLLFLLGGGEKTHIGGAILCSPGEKTETIRLGTHYDYLVLQPIAETACEKYQTTVVAVGGIHIDKATKQEIEKIKNNCKRLLNKL